MNAVYTHNTEHNAYARTVHQAHTKKTKEYGFMVFKSVMCVIIPHKNSWYLGHKQRDGTLLSAEGRPSGAGESSTQKKTLIEREVRR